MNAEQKIALFKAQDAINSLSQPLNLLREVAPHNHSDSDELQSLVEILELLQGRIGHAANAARELIRARETA